MAKLTDTSPMPFGKYKGTPMINVPASYLIYVLENGLKPGSVKDYIIENYEVLKTEIKNNKP